MRHCVVPDNEGNTEEYGVTQRVAADISGSFRSVLATDYNRVGNVAECGTGSFPCF